jgi:hypothetical protein
VSAAHAEGVAVPGCGITHFTVEALIDQISTRA